MMELIELLNEETNNKHSIIILNDDWYQLNINGQEITINDEINMITRLKQIVRENGIY